MCCNKITHKIIYASHLCEVAHVTCNRGSIRSNLFVKTRVMLRTSDPSNDIFIQYPISICSIFTLSISRSRTTNIESFEQLVLISKSFSKLKLLMGRKGQVICGLLFSRKYKINSSLTSWIFPICHLLNKQY